MNNLEKFFSEQQQPIERGGRGLFTSEGRMQRISVDNCPHYEAMQLEIRNRIYCNWCGWDREKGKVNTTKK